MEFKISSQELIQYCDEVLEKNLDNVFDAFDIVADEHKSVTSSFSVEQMQFFKDLYYASVSRSSRIATAATLELLADKANTPK